MEPGTRLGVARNKRHRRRAAAHHIRVAEQLIRNDECGAHRGRRGASYVGLLDHVPAVKRTRRPERRSTRMNHSADRKVPVTTPPMVTAVVSRRNTLTGSMARPTARYTAETANIPAHSQVAPWKNRCSPR